MGLGASLRIFGILLIGTVSTVKIISVPSFFKQNSPVANSFC